MNNLFKSEELLDLFKNFYTLTGIRIVLFDENNNELMSYPNKSTTFCSYMRNTYDFKYKCEHSDNIAFIKCRKTKKLFVYKCHAGLIEAISPLLINGEIIGYIMFGQITDNKSNLLSNMNKISKLYNDEQIIKLSSKIKQRNDKQIIAAAKILDTFTSYIIMKDIIQHTEKEVVKNLNSFIDSHISEDLSVERICKELNINRTKLYELTKNYTSGGIASLIKEKRLNMAKKLITTTNKTIPEISDMVGFNDYNYFLRVFKNKYKISSKKLRAMPPYIT